MYSEKTLRRKAKEVGYTLEKGLIRVRGLIMYPKQTGYSLIDNDLGCYVWGSVDSDFIHLWDIEDVEDFLKSEYQSLGLKF